MQIVWNTEAVERLRNTHTILELETFDVEGKTLTAWCVVPAEKILGELPNIDEYIDQHKIFINALKTHDIKLCKLTADKLMGKFGGELDSFYTEILSRFN